MASGKSTPVTTPENIDLQEVLNRLQEGVALFDGNDSLVFANEKCRELFRPIADEFNPGAPFGQLMARAGDKNILADAFVGPGELEFSEGRAVLLREKPLPEGGVMRTFTDLTEYRRAEAEIVYQASQDDVTGLPNRSLFLDRLGAALRQSARAKNRLAVLFIDLDGFKSVNDTLGHEAGDMVLQQVGLRLVARVRASDTVARFGGDEFTILLLEISTPEDISLVAQSIIDELSRPFSIKGETAVIGASVGIAIFPSDGNDADELIRRADQAMYAVKRSGKRGFKHASELAD